MITISHFQERRKKLFEKMVDNSIALLPASAPQYRNADTEYPFRQESHFHYLTGFDESFAIAVLIKKQGKTKFILLCQDRDPAAEQWTGTRAGIKGACEIYGADEAYSISETALRFPLLFIGLNTIYYLVSSNPAFDRKLFSWMDALRKKVRGEQAIPQRFMDLHPILDEMRLIKSAEEIAVLRKVCDISAQAHIEAMSRCAVGMHEYTLEAILLHAFCSQGCKDVAYPSIVASGENACTLHYTRNNAPIKNNELVLIDAGAEYESYAADITRTFPANGKFTKEQQAIYEIVLAAQTEAISSVTPGLLWETLQQKIVKILVTGLSDLKILKGNVDTLIEEKAYQPFYMHNSGHWLGMDVHDVGHYKVGGASRPLQSGMVFTVEPGLYLSKNNPLVPEAYQGIGIRIEDDILVTAVGKEVLTEKAPKSIQEIEGLMRKAQ